MAAPGVAHKRAGPAGRQVRAQLILGQLALLSINSPAAPGTVLLQAGGQADLAMEAAPELLLELLLAVKESREYVTVDLQYINSLSQVKLIPPPTTKSRVQFTTCCMQHLVAASETDLSI